MKKTIKMQIFIYSLWSIYFMLFPAVLFIVTAKILSPQNSLVFVIINYAGIIFQNLVLYLPKVQPCSFSFLIIGGIIPVIMNLGFLAVYTLPYMIIAVIAAFIKIRKNGKEQNNEDRKN